MDMMKAVAAMGDGTVQVVEVPRTKIKSPYECLVRVTACGLCSSTDLKIISHGSVAQMPIQYPTLIGHEGIGVIEELGEKVRYWKKGDRVVCPFGQPEGGYYYNWNGMGGYAIAHDIRAMIEDGVAGDDPAVAGVSEQDYQVKPIPEGMSDPDAVMLLTMKENYSALKNFNVGPGTKLLIYGDGAVAMGLALFAKLMGAEKVVNIGHHDDRLRRINELAGVDKVINSHTQNVADTLGCVYTSQVI